MDVSVKSVENNTAEMNGFGQYQWRLNFKLLNDLSRLQLFFLVLLLITILAVYALGLSYQYPLHYVWSSISLVCIVGLIFYQRFTLKSALSKTSINKRDGVVVHVNGIINTMIMGGITITGYSVYDIVERTIHFNHYGQPEPIAFVVILLFLAGASFLTYRFAYFAAYWLILSAAYVGANIRCMQGLIPITVMAWIDAFLISMLVAGYFITRTRQHVLWLTVQQSLHNNQINQYVNDVHAMNLTLQKEMSERNNAQKRLSNWAETLEEEVQARTQDIRITSKELENSLQSLEMANQIAGIGLWDWHVDTHTLSQSNAEELLGYNNQELSDFLDTPELMVHPDDLDRFRQSLVLQLIGDNERHDVQFRFKHKDGHWVWLHDIGKVVERDPVTKKAKRMLGIRRNVDTEVRNAEELKLAASVYEHATIGIFVTNAQLQLLEVNAEFQKITGKQRDQVLGLTFGPHIYNQEGQEAFSVLKTLMQEGEYDGEVVGQVHGQARPLWLTIRAVKKTPAEVSHYIGLLTDISSIKASEAKANYLANFDPLTELPNRAQLKQKLIQLIDQAEQSDTHFAVLQINIDRFKSINDYWGEPVGDQILKQVAQRLVSFHPEALLTARYSGDHFVMVVHIAHYRDNDALEKFATQLVNYFNTPFKANDRDIEITVSVGIAVYPKHSKQVDGLLNCAESALIQATASDEKIVIANFKGPLDSHQKIELEQDLRRAVSLHDIDVHFQPKVHLKTGEIVGFEALARWTHPIKGSISPKQFIELAEEIGIISQLGDVVFRKACRQLADWVKAGFSDLHLAVNITVQQIKRQSLIDSIDEMLRIYPEVRGRIEFEITESSLMENSDNVQKFFQAARDRQIDISLDDFGTGYSSLSYLAQYKIDTIKIDIV